MGSIEDNNWVDLIIDKIGFALTKVDESIQKSIELWTELTKDIYDEQPRHDTTGQPNNGKSGEEDSSQNKSVAEVKERPIQHWAMRASKIPESLIQEQGDDDDCDDEDDYSEEKEKEKEEDDEGTVSESSDEDMWELNLKTATSIRSYWPNCYHHDFEEATRSRLKWEDAFEQLKNFDMPSVEEDESWDDDYDEEKEEEDETTVSISCENMSKKSYIPSRYHNRNEEDTGSSLRGRGGYELLKNDDTSSEEDDDSWDNEEEVMEWMRKHENMSDVSYESLVGHYDEDEDKDEDEDADEDEVSNKLQGFADVKEEEIANKSEFGEVETLSPECDWVYVTRN